GAGRVQGPGGGVAPHLRAEPAGLEAEGADPGTDEDVRYRVTVADGKHGTAIPLVEQPHRGGPRRLHPQHSPSLQCLPGGTIPPDPPCSWGDCPSPHSPPAPLRGGCPFRPTPRSPWGALSFPH